MSARADEWRVPVLLPTAMAGLGLGLWAGSAWWGAAAGLVALGSASLTVFSTDRRPLLLLLGLPVWGFLAGSGSPPSRCATTPTPSMLSSAPGCSRCCSRWPSG